MKIFISFDVEASSPTPGEDANSGGSMLSIGACLLNDNSETFYRELKPISSNTVRESTRIGSMGLLCMTNYIKNDTTCDPLHIDFMPSRVLEILEAHGDYPKHVMQEYAEWVIQVAHGSTPIQAAAPIRFDSLWTSWYFRKFYQKDNPFGPTGGLDMNSFYQGLKRNMNARIQEFRSKEHTHDALEDAIQQAEEFRSALASISGDIILLQS